MKRSISPLKPDMLSKEGYGCLSNTSSPRILTAENKFMTLNESLVKAEDCRQSAFSPFQKQLQQPLEPFNRCVTVTIN